MEINWFCNSSFYQCLDCFVFFIETFFLLFLFKSLLKKSLNESRLNNQKINSFRSFICVCCKWIEMNELSEWGFWTFELNYLDNNNMYYKYNLSSIDLIWIKKVIKMTCTINRELLPYLPKWVTYLRRLLNWTIFFGVGCVILKSGLCLTKPT